MKIFGILLATFTTVACALGADEEATSKTNDVDSMKVALQSVLPTNWAISVTSNATPFAHQGGRKTGIEFRLQGPELAPAQRAGKKWNSHEALGIWAMPSDYTFIPENPPVPRAFSGVAQQLGSNVNCVVYQLAFVPGPLNWPTWREDIKRVLKIK